MASDNAEQQVEEPSGYDADRAALLDEQGADANASEAKVELIRKNLAER